MVDSTITLVGFGISGQILLSYILDIIPAYKVAIIDPDFMGGDLAREYGAIESNTTIETKVKSIETLPSATAQWSSTISSLKGRGDPSSTVNLGKLASDLRICGLEMAKKVKCIYDMATAVTWVPEKSAWSVTLGNCTNGGNANTHTTKIICFCTGMLPVKQDYGIPIIPLSVALDPARLERIVLPGQRVVVIGSSHSATLVCKHINAIPDTGISCIYRGSKPFKYARDNDYGGIKQESASIADGILKGDYPKIKLYSSANIQGVSKVIREAQWIVQATGFRENFPIISAPSEVVWDSKSGTAPGVPQAFAFGACVPDTTEVNGVRHPDISVSAFVEQISVRWPLLKTTIQNLL
jgi:hypothetical protein